MQSELTVQNDLGMSLAEAIGVTSEQSKASNLPRVNIMHTGIMGEMEVNGKKIKTEVVSAGSYRVTLSEDNVVYTSKPLIRIFAVRQQLSKWDAAQEVMMKSVMATDLKGDLKDNMGTFNLGRPSGYIQDWGAVPEKTKDLIRSIKRKMIIFGLIEAVDATDEQGNPVEDLKEPTPFVLELPPSSTKSFNNAMASLKRKNVLPIQYLFSVSTTEESMPNGNSFFVASFDGGSSVEVADQDHTILKDFVDYINTTNSYILQQWEEKHQETIASEDASVVAEFVNVEEAD